MLKWISKAVLAFFPIFAFSCETNSNENFPASYEFAPYTPSNLSDWTKTPLDLSTSTYVISDWSQPSIYIIDIDEHLKAPEDILEALSAHGLDGTYSFLSNFYPYIFSDEHGYTYATIEHYYQSHKFPLGSQPFLEVLKAKIPMEAKLLARKYNELPEYPLPSTETLIQVMKEALWHKFVTLKGEPTESGKKLLSTQNWLIVAGNKREPFTDIRWGAEFNFTEGLDHVTLMGENRLGKLLMEIRSYLTNKK